MSYEIAIPGTYEHEQYNALKSLRVQVSLLLGEINIVLDRLQPKDAVEKAEIIALIDEVKATATLRTSEFDEKVNSKLGSPVKG